MSAKAKPVKCRTCDRPLTHPDIGRPRVFCSVGCRRAEEYELRRLAAYVAHAAKQGDAAEARALLVRSDWERERLREVQSYWAGRFLEAKEWLEESLRRIADDETATS